MRLFEQDYEYFSGPAEALYPFERVGYDRLLAILMDLRRLRIMPPARVLDVGCSSGLFALGLAAAGYHVTGIDSNIAADVQGFYPEKPLHIANRLKADLPHAEVEFIQGDVADVLTGETACYDVCLLLSVVHQWFAGYALTGVGAKPVEEIEQLLRRLVARIGSVLYYEGPEDDEAAQHMQLTLPHWFAEADLAKRITPIAVSVAANGDVRTLYRIELAHADGKRCD